MVLDELLYLSEMHREDLRAFSALAKLSFSQFLKRHSPPSYRHLNMCSPLSTYPHASLHYLGYLELTPFLLTPTHL